MNRFRNGSPLPGDFALINRRVVVNGITRDGDIIPPNIQYATHAYPTDSSRSPAAWSCCSVCVVGCCVVWAIGRSLMAAKGTRTPESTNPNQPRTGLIQIRRCSVFGSSKGGRAGGEKDLDWSIEGAIQQTMIERRSLPATTRLWR